MEFETWWLLALPLFFALGWFAARIDIKQLVTESRRLPHSYFRGLNFLLNEQPDKAIEAFIEVVKVEPETVELHFALGNLFRRRGELERAIRMHQNILDREDLGQEQRLSALFELGQDYLKAGLLDRAEEMFQRLIGTNLEQQGLRYLLEIYEQEKDWLKAIETSRKMDTISGESSAKDIAHFYCELASGEMLHQRLETARKYADEALAVNRKCTRASMILGDVEWQTGRVEEAIETCKRIEGQNPAYLPLVADRLLGAHAKLGRPEQGLQLLSGYLASYPSLDLLQSLYQATLEGQGSAPAYELLRDELRRNPTLVGLNRLIEMQLADAAADRRGDLELTRNLIQQHSRSLSLYRCDSCGTRLGDGQCK